MTALSTSPTALRKEHTATSGSRIAIAIVAPNLELGGAERQIVQIANGLDKSKFDVHVISLSKHNPLAPHLEPGVTFHIVERARPIGVRCLWRLHKLLKEIDACVVHGFLYDAEIFSRLAGIGIPGLKVLGSIRNSDYEISWPRLTLKSLTNRFMDLCVSNSQAGIRYNHTLYGDIAAPYRLVRNGVDIDRFQPLPCSERQSIRASMGIAETTPVVGFFASFKAQKNHLALIKAAEALDKQLPGVEYLFVGGELEKGQRNTTEYTAQLNAAIEQSSIRSQFNLLGKREDVEKLYPCCNITVLPSWHEGLPNVVLESLACGVPFVATDVSDNAQIASELDVGLIVPAGDIEALTEALHTSLRQCTPITGAKLAHIRDTISRARMIDAVTEVYLEAIDPDS